MYNQLKLGYTYDLLCPSEYMIMKLAAEDMLEPYSEDFFDESNELNYYVNNVSPFIKEKFDSNTMAVGSGEAKWSEYAAGYMWGTTGLVYNPEYITEEQLELGWALARRVRQGQSHDQRQRARFLLRGARHPL